jgi:hypothetical protein
LRRDLGADAHEFAVLLERVEELAEIAKGHCGQSLARIHPPPGDRAHMRAHTVEAGRTPPFLE